jgi:hypothetical protein
MYTQREEVCMQCAAVYSTMQYYHGINPYINTVQSSALLHVAVNAHTVLAQ